MRSNREVLNEFSEVEQSSLAYSFIEGLLLLTSSYVLSDLAELCEAYVVHGVHFAGSAADRSKTCRKWLARHGDDVRLAAASVPDEGYSLVADVLNPV